MSKTDIISKIEELKSLEDLVKEAEAEMEGLKDELKKLMTDQNVEELEAGTYILRYTTVLSNRFDTTRFKKDHGDLYKEYTKNSTSKRFTVSD